jgi:hypothetical protein
VARAPSRVGGPDRPDHAPRIGRPECRAGATRGSCVLCSSRRAAARVDGRLPCRVRPRWPTRVASGGSCGLADGSRLARSQTSQDDACRLASTSGLDRLDRAQSALRSEIPWKVHVACQGNNQLIVIDMPNMQVSSTQDVGRSPDVLGRDPGLHPAYGVRGQREWPAGRVPRVRERGQPHRVPRRLPERPRGGRKAIRAWSGFGASPPLPVRSSPARAGGGSS